jgi:hypothetical protein
MNPKKRLQDSEGTKFLQLKFKKTSNSETLCQAELYIIHMQFLREPQKMKQ